MAKIDINDVKKRLLKTLTFSTSKKLMKSSAVLQEVEYIDSVNDNLYIFKVNGSYILSPADDTLEPIIGEFDEFPENGEMPPCLKDWFNTYTDEIEYFLDNEDTLSYAYMTYGNSDSDLVDLGLSVNWSSKNLGAANPLDFGNYYAWGELSKKTTYTWNNYKYYENSKAINLGETISKNASYDAAFVLDKNICLPTKELFEELINKCVWTKATVNSVPGWNIKGPNGNSIFFPINGCIFDSSTIKSGYETQIYCWTSNQNESDINKAYGLMLKDKPTISVLLKRTGMAIRPVSVNENKKEKSNLSLVDLGLSVNWADMNIGAESPEDNGNYYAWGETVVKDNYDIDSYEYHQHISEEYINIGDNILKTEYDQAYALSKTLCIPTIEQWKELLNNCKLVERKGSDNLIIGYDAIGPSGKLIFLPFGGCAYDGKGHDLKIYGYYQSSNVASDTHFQGAFIGYKDTQQIKNFKKRTGCSIRPIGTGETPTNLEKSTGTVLVDLGLSVKWADRNLGSTSTESVGPYYAWGDPEPNKKNFNWANYKYYQAEEDIYTDLDSPISKDPNYDIAFIKDSTMCLPNVSQWQELIDKCSWSEITQNNVKCYKVTGPNGNSIYLPLSGYKFNTELTLNNELAYYTTAENYSTTNTNVLELNKANTAVINNIKKYLGCVVRPVSVQQNNLKQTIQPLLPFKWNQTAPFNSLLPLDPKTKKRVITGCTQTALAMIVAYYGCIGINNKKFQRGFPKTLPFTSSGQNGSIKIDGLPPIPLFDYDNMNFKKAADFKTTEAKNAVGNLMRYIGYADHAGYSSDGTSANPLTALTTAKNKLHIGADAKMIYASDGINNFKELIYQEIVNGYPVHISGWNSKGSGGHSFNCDGYNAETDKYHFNFGWGGLYDGWFDMSLLKPTSEDDYSYKKRAMIGLHPDYVFADLNDDNNITVADVMQIVQDIVDSKLYDYKHDLNNDGKIDESDIEYLINYIIDLKLKKEN